MLLKTKVCGIQPLNCFGYHEGFDDECLFTAIVRCVASVPSAGGSPKLNGKLYGALAPPALDATQVISLVSSPGGGGGKAKIPAVDPNERTSPDYAAYGVAFSQAASLLFCI